MEYDEYGDDPCDLCKQKGSCDGWEAAMCVLANPGLLDDPDFDPYDI